MSCPHSRIGDPSRCSQCIGVVPHRVDQVAGELTIDGRPAGRPLNAEAASAARFYGKRGKAQSMRVTRSKR